jgi:molecular chaperone DnaK
MLAERLGLDLRDVRIDINPDEVVARGAGMIARDCLAADGYEGDEVGIEPSGERAAEADVEVLVLQDVTSHSLGVRTEHDRFSVILPKDSRIPGESTQRYTNAGPGIELPIEVYQGEQPIAVDNEYVSAVHISFPEPRPRNYWNLDVTFALDIDGLLHVKVHCANNGKVWEEDMHCSVRSDRNQIDRSAAKLDSEMAGRDTDRAEPSGGLPPPPPEPEPEPPAAPVLPPLPAETPDEFKAIARRSYKTIDRLDPEPGERLRAAYLAFVAAVVAGSDDVEELGDALDDVFHEVR